MDREFAIEYIQEECECCSEYKDGKCTSESNCREVKQMAINAIRNEPTWAVNEKNEKIAFKDVPADKVIKILDLLNDRSPLTLSERDREELNTYREWYDRIDDEYEHIKEQNKKYWQGGEYKCTSMSDGEMYVLEKILGWIDEMFQILHTRPTVHEETLKQVMWERDIAIKQLKDLGYGFGEKIEQKTSGEMIKSLFPDATMFWDKWYGYMYSKADRSDKNYMMTVSYEFWNAPYIKAKRGDEDVS